MDIVAYLRILRRHWKLIVATSVVGALLGVATTLLPGSEEQAQRTFYKATHTLFLDASGVTGKYRPVYTNLDQIAVLATTGEVPRRVADRTGGDANEVVTHIFTVTNSATNTLDIVCAERRADDAEACADAFAEELQTSILERESTRFDAQTTATLERLDSLEAQLTAIDAQIGADPGAADVLKAQQRSLVNAYSLAYETFQGLADQGGPPEVLSTLEEAESTPITKAEYDNRIAQGQLGLNRVSSGFNGEPELVATSDSGSTRFSGPVSRGSLGGLLGLFVGVGLAVALDRADRRLRTREEVESAYGMPVLAEVPSLTPAQQKDYRIESALAPLSRTAEAYRAVRSSLMFQRTTEARHSGADDALVVLVGSAGPKEGKTTTAANLAAVFAETGARVLAINCDFRRPTLHKLFDLPNEPRRVLETEIPGVWAITDVMTEGSHANPALVVEEQRQLAASARSRFDVIILDTAPLLATNDATELMSSCDLVVLTCREGISTGDSARRTRELLSRIAAPISGVILLGSTAAPNDYYYYYSSSSSGGTAPRAEAPADEGDEGDDGLFGPEPAVQPELGLSSVDRPDPS